MRKTILDWLKATEVPRWQIGLGFILATVVTVWVTVYTSTIAIDHQDTIAKVTAFRSSSSKLDLAANSFARSLLTDQKKEGQLTELEQAIIIHRNDSIALKTTHSDPELLSRYIKILVEVRREAERFSESGDGQRFFAAMAILQQDQSKLLDENQKSK